MTTKKTKAEAARENGAKSKGPVTAEGKRIACMNAWKHGLAAKSIRLEPGESANQCLDMHRAAYDRFLPSSPEEAARVDELCVSLWLLRRIVRSEAAALQQNILPDETPDLRLAEARAFEAWTQTGNSFHQLLKYESYNVCCLRRVITAHTRAHSPKS
ncbi:MAG: hypothetical protein IT165_00945 [Bryobacterales bacterium]|nr:hypothetical protein [Bryobacterales bacterium]